MSAQAVQVLLEWAANVSKEIQQKFVLHYNQKRAAYQSDESASGVFDFGDRLITSDGMRQMIANFEEHNDLPRTVSVN